MSDEPGFSKVKMEFFWIRLALNYLSVFIEFLYAFVEMHMVKIVSVAIMAFCCLNVNALHMIIVILLVLSFFFGITVVNHAFHLIGMLLGFLLLTKMMYQTKFIPKIEISGNCTGTELSWDDRFRLIFFDLKWMGYQLLEREENILKLWGSYMLVLLVMTLHGVVYIRQRLKRLDNGKPETIPSVLYPEVTRKMADDGVVPCMKYLFNYGFYKFGIEVTLTTAAFVIAYRMDVLSAFYSFWLLLLFPLRRTGVSRLWPFFFASISLSILWQYAMAVGLSPLICLDYPWEVSQSLSRWLFLASYTHPPDGTKILGDFVLLISVWRQKVVFDIEKRDVKNSYLGGSNKEVFMEYYKPDFVNPVPDQTAFNRSLLNWIINFIVTSMLWMTFAFVYWTGVHNVNVLSLGYLVGAFIFLWIGHDICLWHMEKILKWWNVLLAYTIITIAIKSVYEVAGCVYFEFLNKNFCWLVQLLNLGCANERNDSTSVCVISKGTVLYWDAACFGLILFQRRIFFTYYFLHQVEDIKSIVQLQSKGAQLIEQLMQEQITESENKKRRTLEKIKKSMNRIKEWQKKIHGLNYLEPMDHAAAVHMGDYYMFEEVADQDAFVDELASSSSEDDVDGKGKMRRKFWEKRGKEDKELTMSQFIGTVYRRTTEDDAPIVKKRFRRKWLKEEASEEGSRRNVDSTRMSWKYDSSGAKDVAQKAESPGKSEKEPKLKSAIKFLREFIESICVSMIRYFDKHSKDYRYIDATMKEERKSAKTSLLRVVNSEDKDRFRQCEIARWSNHDREETLKKSHSSSISQNEIRSGSFIAESWERRKTRRRPVSDGGGGLMRYARRYGEPRRRYGSGVYVELILSFSLFVMSHTEFFCYMMIFLHQALSPTILSLPLPLCALLWGSLTTIRPTTTFWVVVIAYTEVTVLIKAVFQNWIFPWNGSVGIRNRPYHPPLLLGIHRNNTYATADLILLFMLFLHRYKLKRLGMWKRTNEEDTSPPQNLGVYNEVLPAKEDGSGEAGLEQELNDENVRDSNRNFFSRPRLATWKCTSRAMAVLFSRRGKIWTRVKVQEIEGNILVTEGGRRLQPTHGRFSENLYDGDIVLRVNSPDEVRGARNTYCKLSCLQHFTPVRKFFMQIMDHKGRLSADFYTLIFFSQFLTFLIVFFGFSHFTDIHVYSSEEHFYLTENQVPLTYLFAVLLHFVIIIIDRILYLRKNVAGKLILQITMVIVVHFWMFIILPNVTEAPFTELTLPQIYYLLKCLYFLMSAYQMRVGYPFRVQGHFLCKKYGYLNYLSYKGLQFIPFFNQLRTLLNYICIKSSLSIMEWIKMESIYQHIFENKCARKADEEYPTRRGIMYPKCKKYIPGSFAFLYMVFLMWFPFFIFAIFETVSLPNQPQIGTLDLTIGSFGSVYQTTAEYESIIPFKYADYDALQTIYRDNKKVWSFLSNYKFEDVAALKFRFSPLQTWNIRRDEFDRLNQTIQRKESPIRVYLSWKILRTQNAQIVGTARGVIQILLGKTGHLRDQFARAFRGEQNRIFVKQVLPKFIQVNNEGSAVPVSGFFSPRNRTNAYRNVTLRLVMPDKSKYVMYWELTELADDELEDSRVRKIPHEDERHITMYTFNQKSIPKTLINISRTGIIGTYLSIVLVLWTFVKRFMSRYPNIMFDDMPNVDRVLQVRIQLCHDVYLARESHEFALEEDLYAKLIFLFRSPETMIKWTRIGSKED